MPLPTLRETLGSAHGIVAAGGRAALFQDELKAEDQAAQQQQQAANLAFRQQQEQQRQLERQQAEEQRTQAAQAKRAEQERKQSLRAEVAKAEFTKSTIGPLMTDAQRAKAESDVAKAMKSVRGVAAGTLLDATAKDPNAGKTTGGFLGFGAKPTPEAQAVAERAQRATDPTLLTDEDLAQARALNPAPFDELDKKRAALDADAERRKKHQAATQQLARAKAIAAGVPEEELPTFGADKPQQAQGNVYNVAAQAGVLDRDAADLSNHEARLQRMGSDLESLRAKKAELQQTLQAGVVGPQSAQLHSQWKAMHADEQARISMLRDEEQSLQAKRRAFEAKKAMHKEQVAGLGAPSRASSVTLDQPSVTPEAARQAAKPVTDTQGAVVAHETSQPDSLEALAKSGSKAFWLDPSRSSAPTPDVRDASTRAANDSVGVLTKLNEERAAAHRDIMNGLAARVRSGEISPDEAQAEQDKAVANYEKAHEADAFAAGQKLDNALRDFQEGRIDSDTLNTVFHAAGQTKTGVEAFKDHLGVLRKRQEATDKLTKLIVGDGSASDDPGLNGQALALANEIAQLKDEGSYGLAKEKQAELAQLRSAHADKLRGELVKMGIDAGEHDAIIANAELHATRQARPGVAANIAAKGGVGAWAAEKLPFVGGVIEAARLLPYAETANKLERGEQPSKEELDQLNEFVRFSQQNPTFAAQAVDGLASLPGFAIELASTEGIANAVKIGGMKGLTAALKKMATSEGREMVSVALRKLAEQQGATNLGKRFASGLAQEAVRLPFASAGRIAEKYMHDAATQGVTLTPDETNLVATIDRTSPNARKGNVARIADAVADTFIENLSERSGHWLGYAMPKAAKEALAKMAAPVKERLFKTALVRSLVSANPGVPVSTLSRVLAKAKIGSTLSEMGEERVGDLARDLWKGVSTGQWGISIPTTEQLASEFVTFLVPGAKSALDVTRHFGKQDSQLQASDAQGTQHIALLSNPTDAAAHLSKALGTTIAPDEVKSARDLIGNVAGVDSVRDIDRAVESLMQKSNAAMQSGDLDRASKFRLMALEQSRTRPRAADMDMLKAVSAVRQIADIRKQAATVQQHAAALAGDLSEARLAGEPINQNALQEQQVALQSAQALRTQADRASALVKIARGRDTMLTAQEQRAIGDAVEYGPQGSIITDAARDELRQIAPAAADYIKQSETQRREELANVSARAMPAQSSAGAVTGKAAAVATDNATGSAEGAAEGGSPSVAPVAADTPAQELKPGVNHGKGEQFNADQWKANALAQIARSTDKPEARQHMVATIGAAHEVLRSYGKIFEGGVEFAKTGVPGGLVFDPDRKALTINLASLATNTRGLQGDELREFLDDRLNHEVIHVAADAVLTQEQVTDIWKRLGKHDAGKRLMRVVERAYFAAWEARNEKPPAWTNYQAGHELLRMMVQDKAFAHRISEAVAVDKGLLADLRDFLLRIADWLNMRIAALPASDRTTLESHRDNVIEALRAMGILEGEQGNDLRASTHSEDVTIRDDANETPSGTSEAPKEAAKPAVAATQADKKPTKTKDYSRYSAEQQALLRESDEQHAKDVAHAKNFGDDREAQEKKLKAAGMRHAARFRQITGKLTAKEQAAKAAYEASNHVGKAVSVDGVNGEIVGHAFGRVKVRLADGAVKTVEPDKIAAPINSNAAEGDQSQGGVVSPSGASTGATASSSFGAVADADGNINQPEATSNEIGQGRDNTPGEEVVYQAPEDEAIATPPAPKATKPKAERRKKIMQAINPADEVRNASGVSDETLDKVRKAFEGLGATERPVDLVSFFDGYTLTAKGQHLLGAPVRAYHGTPHKVDKFSLEKIGTGEGAQAFGWGLYFAESRDVGEGYRDKLAQWSLLTSDGKIYDDRKELKNLNVRAVLNKNGSIDEAVARARSVIESIPGTQGAELALADIATLEKLKQSGGLTKTKGNLYTVELLPDESEFLDWDKPLSEQKNPKLDALKKQHRAFLQDPAQRISDKGKNGDSLYHMVTRQKGSEKAASDYLASLGIPGIKYLDGGSRGKGDGTRNYVLFDDKLVKILEENGNKLHATERAGQAGQSDEIRAIGASVAKDLERNKLERVDPSAFDWTFEKADDPAFDGDGYYYPSWTAKRYEDKYLEKFVPLPSIGVLENGKFYIGDGNAEYDSLDEAKRGVMVGVREYLEENNTGFQSNMDGQQAAADVFHKTAHLFAPYASDREGWGGTKWGSWYFDATDDEGSPLKLSIRDHEATRKDMGLPDKSWEVSKNWDPKEVAEALVKALEWLQKNAVSVSQDGMESSTKLERQPALGAGQAAQSNSSSPGGLTEAEVKTPMTIYRAGDASEVGVKPFSSWSPDIETAKKYLDNPGFGGDTLRTLRVDAGSILDADTTNRPGMRKLAVALGFDAEKGDEWFDDGYRYPWEESSKVSQALKDSGFDAVRYKDDFPEGATTIIFTKEPKLIRSSFDTSAPALGAPVRASVQQTGLPRDRRAAFMDLADSLIEQGITEPAKLAKVLEAAHPDGRLRKYSQAMWNYLGTVSPELSGTHDWSAIYNTTSAPTDDTKPSQSITGSNAETPAEMPVPETGEASPVDQAAHEAATSPLNDRAEPTQAQKEAGNYKLGHLNISGLDISVENPAGSERKGTDASGKPWSVTMADHYGYLKGSLGRDKDHIDIFVEPGTPEDFAGPVFVVNQNAQDGGFDEHKAVLGPSITTAEQARAEYLKNYSPGWKGAGDVVKFDSVAAFKAWATERQRRGAVRQETASAFSEAVKLVEQPTKPYTIEQQNADRSARIRGEQAVLEASAKADLAEQRRSAVTLVNLHQLPHDTIIAAARQAIQDRKDGAAEGGLFPYKEDAAAKRFRVDPTYINALKVVHDTLKAKAALKQEPRIAVNEAPVGEQQTALPSTDAPQASEIDRRIADAEASGVVLSDADKAKIRKAFEDAEDAQKQANRLSGSSSDPLNKGTAFPMGVGFTRMTKRAEQRIDASVKKAGEAVRFFNKAKLLRADVEALLAGKGTEADKAAKADKRKSYQTEVAAKLLTWKKGDKIASFTIERVNMDRDGYPSSYTISGDGIVKGVHDKVDVVKEIFGGDKQAFRKTIDEARTAQQATKDGAIVTMDAPQASQTETPERGDTVIWTDGAGKQAISMIDKLDTIDGKPVAWVEWFGVRTVPLADVTLKTKSSQRLNRERREAEAAAKAGIPAKEITTPEPVKESQPVKGPALTAQKKFLLEKIDDAIAEAPAEFTRKAGNVVIEVPGDGTFTILNNKKTLREFKDMAKSFPTTVPKPDLPTATTLKASGIPALAKGKVPPQDKVRVVGLFAAKDDDRPGINFVADTGDAVVATDGRVLFFIEQPGEGSQEKPVFYKPTGGKTESEDRYPQWRQVVPKDARRVFSDIDTGRLWQIAKQASAVYKEAVREVKANNKVTVTSPTPRIEFMLNKDGSLGLRTPSYTADEINGSYEHNVTPGAESIGVLDADYVMEVLRAMRALGSDSVNIGIAGTQTGQNTFTFDAGDAHAVVMEMAAPVDAPAQAASAPDTSDEYKQAVVESRKASAAFAEAQRAYRARQIDDDAFLAAKALHDAASQKFDEAAAKEQKRLQQKGDSEKLPEGSFAGADAFRQTGTNTRLVTITKPNELSATERPVAVSADQDAVYMRAVESGDMATAQRMVDEAAKAAGYNVGPVYHGTRAPQMPTVFKSNTEHSLPWVKGVGLYFTSDKVSAQNYGSAVGAFYLAAKNPHKATGFEHTSVSKDVMRKLKSEGKDSMFFDGRYANQSGKSIQAADEWVVFDANQIKSADPITRDESGNVIPLSQRFNNDSNSILYATERPGLYADPEFAAMMEALTTPGESPFIPLSDAARDLVRDTAGAKYGPDFTAEEAAQIAMNLNGGITSAYQDQRERETHAGWIATAAKILETDGLDNVARELLADPARLSFNPVKVKLAQMAADQLAQRALLQRSPADRETAERLLWAYNVTGTQAGRAVAARDHVHASTEELHRRAITNMLFTPPAHKRAAIERAISLKEKNQRIAELERQLEDVRAKAAENERGILGRAGELVADVRDEAEKARAAANAQVAALNKQIADLRAQRDQSQLLAEANQARIAAIEADLARDFGLTLHDLFVSREALVRLRGSAIVKNALAGFNQKEALAQRLRMEGKSDRQIQKQTGISEKALADVFARVDEALTKQLEPWLDRGFSLGDFEQLDDQGNRIDPAKIIDDKGNLLGATLRAKITTEEKAARLKSILGAINSTTEARNTGALKRTARFGDGNNGFGFDLNRPEHAAMVARAIQRTDSNASDMIYEYWINGLLSGPATQTANIAGNTASTVLEFAIQRPLEAMINATLFRDAAGAQLGEYRSMAKYASGIFATAVNRAKRAWQTEISTFDAERLDQPLVIRGGNGKNESEAFAIGGTPGRVIRTPSRLLNFADEFAKYLVGGLEAAAQAHRLAKANGLTGEEFDKFVASQVNTNGSQAWLAAVDKTHRLTFTNELPDTLAKVNNLLRSRATTPGGAVLKFFLRMVFPFVRTPYNIFATGLRKTPLGTLRMAGKATAGLVDSWKGTRPFFDSYPKAALAGDMAEQLVGWVAALVLAGMAEGDPDDERKHILITGSRSENDSRGEAQLLNRTRGGETTILVNGKPVFNYGRIEPFATVVSTMVDAVREWKKVKGGEPPAKAIENATRALADQARSKTFLQGFDGLMQLIDGHTRSLPDAAVRAIVTGAVPNLVRQPLRNVDSFARDTRNAPWYYQALPLASLAEPLYDLYGRPIEKDFSPWSRVALGSVTTKVLPVQPADRALERWNKTHEGDPQQQYNPVQPSVFRFKDAQGKWQQMRPDVIAKFRRDAGRAFAADAIAQFASPTAPTAEEVRGLRSVKDRSYDATKKNLLGAGVQPPQAARPMPTLAELFGQRLR